MRAWRSAARLNDPAGLRPWTYRIATNVCIDASADRKRRALPMDLVAAADPRGELGAPLPESTWVQPFPSSPTVDPSERAVSNESVRLAFVATLQYLLPRQRAVLILRDVLCWRAAEVAELLDLSVDAGNSMLRRARAALAQAQRADGARDRRLARHRHRGGGGDRGGPRRVDRPGRRGDGGIPARLAGGGRVQRRRGRDRGRRGAPRRTLGAQDRPRRGGVAVTQRISCAV
ncbi:sigma factor-like helix-turn-helix DNA-binding protein [Nocardia tengchongensis]